MAYQQVIRPRFYIDWLSYCNNIGNISSVEPNVNLGNDDSLSINGNFLGLQPTSTCLLKSEDETITYEGNLITIRFHHNTLSVLHKIMAESYSIDSVTWNKGFAGILGHDFYSSPLNNALVSHNLESKNDDLNVDPIATYDFQRSIINSNKVTESMGAMNGKDYIVPSYNGFSLYTIDPTNVQEYNADRILLYTHLYKENVDIFQQGLNTYMNSFCLGHFFDVPRSPDLELTLEFENKGIDTFSTLGGSDISNARYTHSSSWGALHPWEISDNITYEDTADGLTFLEMNREAPLLGKRIWKLSFSFMSDKDLFPATFNTRDVLNTDADVSMYTNDEIDNDAFFHNSFVLNDNFFSRVLHFISSGQRFIFQPDRRDAQQGSFAVCILDQDSLSFSQSAPGIWDVSLEIREVW